MKLHHCARFILPSIRTQAHLFSFFLLDQNRQIRSMSMQEENIILAQKFQKEECY